MSYTPFTFILIVLATGQVIDTWNHGSIFISWRDRLQTSEGWFAELLRCPYCLSHHVPYLLLLPAIFMPAKISTIAIIVIWSLAITRVTLLIDGLLPERLRYESDDDDWPVATIFESTDTTNEE